MILCELLPGVGGSPLISQVTRTDPALLQYALKSFGTLNLSEDDWKKAEDHYKVNILLYELPRRLQNDNFKFLSSILSLKRRVFSIFIKIQKRDP